MTKNLNNDQKIVKEYVNNDDFRNALMDYKGKSREAVKLGLQKPPIPEYIGECFLKIAEGLSHKHQFINYPFREEMVGDAIENCLMYFENFDAAKSKYAFAYFTQIAWYAFLRRIQKEKKQLYVRYKSIEQFGILDEHEMLGYEESTGKQFEMYDNISEFIENFEDSKKKKKESKKIKGVEKFLED